MTIAGVLLASYLIGSFPTSYVVVYRLTGRDIRTMGSGNPGAMNVWDSVGMGPAILVAFVDVVKGMAPVGAAYAIGLTDIDAVLVTFAAVAGHDYSIFLRLRGGNGTATGLGASLMLLPAPTLIATAVGIGLGVSIGNRRIGGAVAMVTFLTSAVLIATPPVRLYGGAALVALAVAQIIYDEGFHLTAVRSRTRR
ncbi:MAG: glycerol-3-phosphate acyltransferase [Dehalococcoidia bacterium]|nr:glycerol-3-phosphate acyltransferase [Dehalococcoidia bacterium]